MATPLARSAASLRPLRQHTQPHYEYLLSVPPTYHQRPEQRWPLVLFLHSAGEGGPGELDRVKIHGPPRLVAAYAGDAGAAATGLRPEPVNMRCGELLAEAAITVTPQLDYIRLGYGWQPEGLISLLDELCFEPRAPSSHRHHHPHPSHQMHQQWLKQQQHHTHHRGVRSSGGGVSGGGGSPSAGSSSGGASTATAGSGSARSSTAGGRSSSGGYSYSGGGSVASVDDPADLQHAEEELEPVVMPLRVDLDRVYVTGISMGGYGTWRLAGTYPDRFAAIAPICGGADPRVASVAALRDMPIWNFHGELDDVIPISASEEVIGPLQAAGAPDLRFTRYPDLGHDCWTRAYNTPELWTWLLEHSRARRAAGERGGGSSAGGSRHGR